MKREKPRPSWLVAVGRELEASRGAQPPSEAEAVLTAWLAKQNPKPGPMFGAVLAERTTTPPGQTGVPYVYRDGVYAAPPRSSSSASRPSLGRRGPGTSRTRLSPGSRPTPRRSTRTRSDRTGINVRNGILRWTGKCWRLEKHDPSFRTTVQFPVTFNPAAECPVYDDFLGSSLPDPDVRKLADEWMGFNLTPDYSFHKALMTSGESGSWKSVFLEVLGALLGKDNTASLALRELTTDTFGTADLYGKVANICTDIESAELRSTCVFKHLVAGEVVRAQAKHKDAFDFRNTAKFSFSANEVPSTRDTTSAFFERWLVIIFPHKFRDTPRDRRDLKATITGSEEEMSGVLNRALAGLTRLRRQQSFTGSRWTDEARLLPSAGGRVRSLVG
jgi:putative DNA primase/helicase